MTVLAVGLSGVLGADHPLGGVDVGALGRLSQVSRITTGPTVVCLLWSSRGIGAHVVNREQMPVYIASDLSTVPQLERNAMGQTMLTVADGEFPVVHRTAISRP